MSTERSVGNGRWRYLLCSMPLDDVEFGPGDDLWDLAGFAAERGAAQLADPNGWVLVVSERQRLEGEPPEPDWGDSEARFDVDECRSVEEARGRAHDLMAPGGVWRAAVVWREGDQLLIEAQDAETDSMAGRFVAPIKQRKRLLRPSEPFLGELGFPEPAEALRSPTWNGTTWTLRAGDRAVAELRVQSTNLPWLLADVTPLPGLEDVLPESPYSQAPTGAWSLHQPDGSRVEPSQLELNRQHASWTWEGALEGPEMDPVHPPHR
jgi:hypothetical protein